MKKGMSMKQYLSSILLLLHIEIETNVFTYAERKYRTEHDRHIMIFIEV